tara:strand:- start:734 stop:1213 length:480 start_codon:yes stop_codon:yes gene_type:complete
LGNRTSTTPAGVPVQDESLRLVLSVEQEHWIKQQLGMAKGLAWASAFFLMLSAGWMAALFSGAIFEGSSSQSCFELAADTPNYQTVLKEFRAQGLSPCPPDKEPSEEFEWNDLLWLPTLIAAIALVVSPLALGRNMILARRYKGYLTDHESFLRKYNRL